MRHGYVWFRVALVNFALAAALGVVLRLIFVTTIPFPDFVNGMHAHSHTAMLGWLYLGIYALLVSLYLPENQRIKWFYGPLFWITEVVVLGIYISMLILGYAPVSIVFLTLHILLSYAFMFRFLKDLNALKEPSGSSLFVRAAFFFMFLSTLALWAIGPLIASGKAGSAFYYATIQFFLHFQFNGWFIFAGLGILLRLLERSGMRPDLKATRQFFWLLVVSCLLTYVLAVTWSTPIPLLFWVNSIGVIIQLIALILLAKLILPLYKGAKRAIGPVGRQLLGVAMIAFGIKVIIQAAVVIPHIATVAYTIRNFVIGFIHLILLGFMTHLLLGAAIEKGWLDPTDRLTKIGLVLFFIGFIATESLLFLQGAMFWGAFGFIPAYYELILGASIILAFGTLVLVLRSRRVISH